jgi:hypothetical protein
MCDLVQSCTILEDCRPVQLEAGRMVCILILLRVAHIEVYCVDALTARVTDEG